MRRFDYLQGLGVTCVWLQPFYKSPNRDNGYDVADFYSVQEQRRAAVEGFRGGKYKVRKVRIRWFSRQLNL